MTETEQTNAKLSDPGNLTHHFNQSTADQRSFRLSTTSLTSNAMPQRFTDGAEPWHYKAPIAPIRFTPKTPYVNERESLFGAIEHMFGVVVFHEPQSPNRKPNPQQEQLMRHIVLLTLAEAGAAEIYRYWRESAPHRELPPHLTFAIYENTNSAVTHEAIAHAEQFAAETNAFDIELTSLGIFPAGPTYVLFLAGIVTAGLLNMHKHFHERSITAGFECKTWYSPDCWVPHCTLADGLDEHAIASATAAALNPFSGLFPMTCKLDAVEVLEVDIAAVRVMRQNLR